MNNYIYRYIFIQKMLFSYNILVDLIIYFYIFCIVRRLSYFKTRYMPIQY